MSGWMKKKFTAVGVTEWPPGPCLGELNDHFGFSGAVMLLLDVSGSMLESAVGNSSRLDQAKIGCQGFIDEAVEGGYEPGLLLWNHQVSDYAIPSLDGQGARSLLAAAQASGGTNVVPALEQAGQILMRIKADDRIIAIFGDGHLGPAVLAKQEATRLNSLGIRIITLGLGEESALALGDISTESEVSMPRTTTDMTLAKDIRSMATGLMRSRPKR